MQKSAILLGRGPSVYDTKLPKNADIIAVSSGIFALPERRTARHFVSLDYPKYFMEPLNGHAIAWRNDERCKRWPFWADAGLTKHVHYLRNRPGFNRKIPIDVFDQLPPHLVQWRERMKDALIEQYHEIGFQPNWGDFSNVRGWKVGLEGDVPNFTRPNELLHLNSVRNSVLMAVQVAALLGYRRLYFAGIDLIDEGYEVLRETLIRWHRHAVDAGIEWRQLSPISMLGQFTQEMATA